MGTRLSTNRAQIFQLPVRAETAPKRKTPAIPCLSIILSACGRNVFVAGNFFRILDSRLDRTASACISNQSATNGTQTNFPRQFATATSNMCT